MTERRNMAWLIFVLLILFPTTSQSASYDPLHIEQPSVTLSTEQNGYIGINSGIQGNISINPGAGGSVYIDGEDLLHIIQMIRSQPPVWQAHGPSSDKTPYGYIGAFKAGQRILETVSAVDPEGLNITYSKVAGDFPPGLSLNSASGQISGVIPDADATYVFTIRATDLHGKYADNVFKIVVRGYDGCTTNPCLNEGLCKDDKENYICECVPPYGGLTCNLDCRSNPLGIQQSLQYVKDGQMTGYHMDSFNNATQARLNSGSGWIGLNEESYLQIDLGNTTDIYRVDTQYYTNYYYTDYFYLQYSLNGNDFYNYTDYMGTTQRLTGSTSSSTYSFNLPNMLTTRFVRIHPLSWNRSYKPAFRIEMYGCYGYKK